MLRGQALLEWLRALPPGEREATVEQALGLGTAPSTSPGTNLVGYHPSGTLAVLDFIAEVPIRADDVVVDLGAGLGKVLLLVHLATGARCRGVDLQAPLVERANETAAKLGLSPEDVSFTAGDARTADVDEGTVFYLYAPFDGPVLDAVMRHLQASIVRKPRRITLCTVGIDLERAADWLVRRAAKVANAGGAGQPASGWADASFWLALYDSR